MVSREREGCVGAVESCRLLALGLAEEVREIDPRFVNTRGTEIASLCTLQSASLEEGRAEMRGKEEEGKAEEEEEEEEDSAIGTGRREQSSLIRTPRGSRVH